MFAFLVATFIAFVVADAFLSASVIHHLRRYSLPGWTLTRIVIPIYLGLQALLLALAVIWLFHIRIL